jgi:hypothetical protein
MKIFKRILLILLIGFIILQFFRPEKNISKGPQPNNIANAYPVPANVKNILAKACNDCHSNNTRYPWYSYIQPVAWWLSDHVEEGKRELNFDEFLAYRPRKQYTRLDQSNELVKEGGMPLDSYTWMHKDAKLTNEEKQALATWAENTRALMEAKYPIDSLVRKK